MEGTTRRGGSRDLLRRGHNVTNELTTAMEEAAPRAGRSPAPLKSHKRGNRESALLCRWGTSFTLWLNAHFAHFITFHITNPKPDRAHSWGD